MANGNFGGGNGSLSYPYLVEDAEDLNAVRNHLGTSTHFKQTQDIDLSSYDDWTPISNSTNISAGFFNSSYNGDNFKIKNLKINKPNSDNQSLFGIISRDCNFLNIIIEGATVSGRNSTAIFVSELGGSTTFTDCSVQGQVVGGNNVSLFIVSSTSIIIRCSGCKVDGVLSADGGFVGGLATQGGSSSSNYEQCSVNAEIIVSGNTSSGVGGLIGSCSQVNISDCFTTGSMLLTGSSSLIGGLIGRKSGSNPSTHYVRRSYSDMDIFAHSCSNVGGLIGLTTRLTTTVSQRVRIVDSYSSGNVFGNAHVGGLIGNAECVELNNCYASGELSGVASVGGLVGFLGFTSPINTMVLVENCFSLKSKIVRRSLNTSIGDFYGTASSFFTSEQLSDMTTYGLNSVQFIDG